MGTGWADAAGAQSLAQNTGDITSLLSARLMAQKLAWAQQQSQAMDAGAAEKADAARMKADQTDFLARKKAMDPFEDRILKRQEGEAETGLKKQQLSQAAQEASLRANLENERMGMEGQQLNELMRHNRAQEGIESKRIDASGANRTVQVRKTDPVSGVETIQFMTPAEAQKLGAFQAPPTAGQKKTIAEAQAAEEALKNIQSLYKPEYVGPLAGRMGSFENYTGIGVTPERAQFTSAVAALKNQVIHDITGAQMSQAEASRILAAVPDVTNPPEVFQARMAETLKNRERIRQAMGGHGTAPAVASPAPASAAAPTSAYDLYLQRMKGGG
jgi:hypothetical protein